MGAERNPIAEDWRILSLGAIKVEPERLQSRAGLDMAVVHKYLDSMRGDEKRGLPPAAFPPVQVAELPDGDLWLYDGFHRYQARWKLWKEKRCEHNIRAVVRRMTMEEAVLAGIAANQQDVNAKRLTREDAEHAVKLMIRDPELRTWSDSELNRRTGVSLYSILKMRTFLRDTEGIPLPDRVKTFSKDGRPTGKTRVYKDALITGPTPRQSKNRNGTPRSRLYVGGKSYTLPPEPDQAEDRQAEILAGFQARRANLGTSQHLRNWLLSRGVLVGGPWCYLGGIRVGDVALVPFAEATTDTLLRELGRAFGIWKYDPTPHRIILVGYRDGRGRQVPYDVFASSPLPIEFMTPEEVVAAFGPEGGEGSSAP